MPNFKEKFGLPFKTILKLNQIFNQNPKVEQVLIYGSRAKGNYRTGSDIDLTIKGKQLEWKDLQNIELKIDDLMLPYKVDLSIYDLIDNQDLLTHISRWGLEFKTNPSDNQ
ncbi:MAG: nucleotidyltransferase domain-containing protein [Gammaproteobacteria bacterium]|nr:nucleotidyltransferase domain-containing protein [Gammaproteobacteria bacterium]